MGYIDGIHGAPYIAAPWILWVLVKKYIDPDPDHTWMISDMNSQDHPSVM